MNNQYYQWVSSIVLAVTNISLAFFACAIVLWLSGVNVGDAISQIYYGAFGTQEGQGYTLYYATNFIFSGLLSLQLTNNGLKLLKEIYGFFNFSIM